MTAKVKPPTGLMRLVWRAPVWLYRLRLGWILGNRFIAVNHIGRKTGLPRQAVVEAVKYDRKSRTYYAASGYGPKSDWYQNVLAHPDVTIEARGKTIPVRAAPLPPEECGQLLVDYSHRYPIAARGFMYLIRQRPRDDAEYFAIGRDLVPFVAFQRRESSTAE
jgi:deazaflavin-dependent oxidoreductase (nitroreductase family)